MEKLKPSELKEATPEITDNINPVPKETGVVEKVPEESKLKEDKPEQSGLVETKPDITPQKEELPSTMNEENCVVIGGQKIEIKPTKLKYFRNKTASSDGVLKQIPLTELLLYGKGMIDQKRDSDQILFDFLIAVFDDADFVLKNYDEMTADDVERILNIFGRINHIDEKEEQIRKNKEAQAAKH